ncbi:sugar kinase [Dinoroseobacter sp. S124A]|uniref:sugar kinase n=1 Tax=Dinoroseobacter sp. S124A TaxID=3415128 RepID=UPI003C7E440D
MADADILTLGEPLIEMVRLPGPPSDAPDALGLFQQGVGGDTLNAAVAAARAGARAGLLGAVGGDLLGDAVRGFCAEEGVATTHLLCRTEDPTGLNVIDPDPAGRRFAYARRGSAASFYGPDDLPVAVIEAARVLHVSAVSQAISRPMREAVWRAAQIARSAGTLVSYDLNLRLSLWSLEEARACMTAFLPMADIVLPSEDEAALFLGHEDPEATLAYFEALPARHVVFKRGRAGAILCSGGARHVIPAISVEAVDSTGAGDCLAGTFLAGLVAGSDPGAAAAQAVRAAAETVRAYGATAGPLA